MKSEIKLFDTTLRDGAQTEGVSFSLQDKLKITELLDEIGMDYIEGGWPGANPKDTEYFEIMKKRKLKNARVVAFGSTKRAKTSVENDPGLKAIIESEVEQVDIFAKGWDFHVTEVLQISLEENLEIIHNSIEYLKRYIPHVVLGIEHFFDGYKANPEYTLQVVKTAYDARSLWIGMADTNGGCLPEEIERIVKEVTGHFNTDYSIHVHNDMGLAVVNTMRAAECGVKILHGTINGLGERCGMTDHCILIPNLKLKMGIDCISDEQLKRLREISVIVAELSNMSLPKYTPYVGKNAFYHKGGIHVDAMLKNPRTYDHIEPELVGNKYLTAISELSGKANVLFLAKEYGIKIEKNAPEIIKLLNHIKKQENVGFQYEGAGVSRYMLFKRYLEGYHDHVKIEKFIFSMNKGSKGTDLFKDENPSRVEAIVVMKIDDKLEEIAATEERGPLASLWKAVLQGVEKYYSGFTGKLRVTDLKLRVIDYTEMGLIRKLRVSLEITDIDNGAKWNTVGASSDIYTAFLEALLDGIEYKILKSSE